LRANPYLACVAAPSQSSPAQSAHRLACVASPRRSLPLPAYRASPAFRA